MKTCINQMPCVHFIWIMNQVNQLLKTNIYETIRRILKGEMMVFSPQYFFRKNFKHTVQLKEFRINTVYHHLDSVFNIYYTSFITYLSIYLSINVSYFWCISKQLVATRTARVPQGLHNSAMGGSDGQSPALVPAPYLQKWLQNDNIGSIFFTTD